MMNNMTHTDRALRRDLLTLVPATLLSACGFQLRQAPSFQFKSLYIAIAPNSSLGQELKRQVQGTGAVQLLTEPTQALAADVVLESLADQREKVVVGVSAAGQVREFQLRVRFRFRLRTPQGKELAPDTELLLQRDISYNESQALSKEAEEALLYRDMQSDIVQQVMRRLAAVRLG